jgi:acetyl esterase/lipase
MRIGTLAAFVFICSAASGVFAQASPLRLPPAINGSRHFVPGWSGGGIDRLHEGTVPLDLYYPKDTRDYPTVVWFHGGGLTSGERFVPEPLMNRKLVVAAVNYRLSPKVKCLDSIDDAAAAVAWVIQNIEAYGGNPSLVFVSGHSAGGYLTAMIGLDKHWLAKYGVDANRIAGLIPFSGHAITHFTIRAEQGIPGTQAVVDEFAPLSFVRPDAPPLVLITGDREMELLGRYEENAYLMRMMKLAGHRNTTLYELQGFNHGGMASPAYFILLRHIEQDGIHRDPEAYLAWLQPILSREDFLQAAIDLSDLWLRRYDRSFPIARIDPPAEGTYPGNRGPEELAIYTPACKRPATGTNPWGKEAIVVQGIVNRVAAGNSPITSDGFVVSGHGAAAEWIAANLQKGTPVEHSTERIEILPGKDSKRETSPEWGLRNSKIRLFTALRAMRGQETSVEMKQDAGALLEKIQALQSSAAGKEDLKAIEAGVNTLEKMARP